MGHKYEIDRRYPFEATADTTSSNVPDGSKIYLWFKNGRPEGPFISVRAAWYQGRPITHFLVTEYPPEKHTAWVNVYPSDYSHAYCMAETRGEANKDALDDRLACIKIEWTEGEGL